MTQGCEKGIQHGANTSRHRATWRNYDNGRRGLGKMPKKYKGLRTPYKERITENVGTNLKTR